MIIMIITSYKYEWQVIGGIFGGIYIYIVFVKAIIIH